MMTGVFIRRERNPDTGRTQCDNSDRDGTDVSTSQGTPRIASNARS